jgi:hypothetical protein
MPIPGPPSRRMLLSHHRCPCLANDSSWVHHATGHEFWTMSYAASNHECGGPTVR